MEGKPTDYFEMGVEVTLSQQRFWQLPQEDLEHGCHVIGVVVPRLQVNVRPVVEHLSQGLLPDAVPRHSEETLHMQA